LRKRAIAGLLTPDSAVAVTGHSNRELYQVIQEKQTSGNLAGQMFGSDRVYVVPPTAVFNKKNVAQISINPEELEDVLKDKEKLKDAYDAHILQQQQQSGSYSTNNNENNLLFNSITRNISTTSHV
jgi:hypothetical protein